jgi:hypothetical protein
MRENADRVIATRERTADRLRELGLGYWTAKQISSFAEHDRARSFLRDEERGVLVRWFNKPRLIGS